MIYIIISSTIYDTGVGNNRVELTGWELTWYLFWRLNVSTRAWEFNGESMKLLRLRNHIIREYVIVWFRDFRIFIDATFNIDSGRGIQWCFFKKTKIKQTRNAWLCIEFTGLAMEFSDF